MAATTNPQSLPSLTDKTVGDESNPLLLQLSQGIVDKLVNDAELLKDLQSALPSAVTNAQDRQKLTEEEQKRLTAEQIKQIEKLQISEIRRLQQVDTTATAVLGTTQSEKGFKVAAYLEKLFEVCRYEECKEALEKVRLAKDMLSQGDTMDVDEEESIEDLHGQAGGYVKDLLEDPSDELAQEAISAINDQIEDTNKKIDIKAIIDIVSPDRKERIGRLILNPKDADGLKALQDINTDLQDLTAKHGYPSWQYPTSTRPDEVIHAIYASMTTNLAKIARTGGDPETLQWVITKNGEIVKHAKEAMNLDEDAGAGLQVKVDEYCRLAKPGFGIVDQGNLVDKLEELRSIQIELSSFLAENFYPPSWGFGQFLTKYENRSAKAIHWPWPTVTAENGDVVLCEIQSTTWITKEDREEIKRKFVVEFRNDGYFQREITKIDSKTLDKWDELADKKVITAGAGNEARYGAKDRKRFGELHWIAYERPEVRDKSRGQPRAPNTRCFISFSDTNDCDLVTRSTFKAILGGNDAEKNIKRVCKRDGMDTPQNVQPQKYLVANPDAPKRRRQTNSQEEESNANSGISSLQNTSGPLDKRTLINEIREEVVKEVKKEFNSQFEELKNMMQLLLSK